MIFSDSSHGGGINAPRFIHRRDRWRHHAVMSGFGTAGDVRGAEFQLDDPPVTNNTMPSIVGGEVAAIMPPAWRSIGIGITTGVGIWLTTRFLDRMFGKRKP